MKLVLALLGGAALGVAATRFRRSAPAPSTPPPGPVAVGPGRVAVDVSAFAD
jgi:hypothetical protein